MDRQKILIIFGVAWLSAALLTWIFIAKTRGPRTESTKKALAVNRDLPIGTRLKKTDLKPVQLRDSDLPKGAVLDEKDAIDRALLYPMSANEPLIVSKLAAIGGAEGIPATIEPGMRAISVPVNDTSSVAGLIQ